MLEFKPFNSDLAKQYAKLKNIPEVFENGYDNTPNPFTEKDAIDFLEKYSGNDPAQRFFIYWNNQLAGEIGITLKDDVFRLNAEIGYFIGKEFWGNGIATQAVTKMTDYAFENFNVIRIVAGVFAFNKASMKVLERSGYYLECIRKKSVIKNGEIMDDYIWVKLKDENEDSRI